MEYELGQEINVLGTAFRVIHVHLRTSGKPDGWLTLEDGNNERFYFKPTLFRDFEDFCRANNHNRQIEYWEMLAQEKDKERLAAYEAHNRKVYEFMALAKELFLNKGDHERKIWNYLERNVKKQFKPYSLLDTLKDYIRKAEERKADETKEVARKEREAEHRREDEKRKMIFHRHVAAAIVYLDMDIEASVYDVLKRIYEKDKYIPLAYAMEATRGNWNSGYDRVRDALKGFEVVTENDQSIIDAIQTILSEDDERDGRVFRDMHWNYDRIYGLADQTLLTLHWNIVQNMDE